MLKSALSLLQARPLWHSKELFRSTESAIPNGSARLPVHLQLLAMAVLSTTIDWLTLTLHSALPIVFTTKDSLSVWLPVSLLSNSTTEKRTPARPRAALQGQSTSWNQSARSSTVSTLATRASHLTPELSTSSSQTEISANNRVTTRPSSTKSQSAKIPTTRKLLVTGLTCRPTHAAVSRILQTVVQHPSISLTLQTTTSTVCLPAQPQLSQLQTQLTLRFSGLLMETSASTSVHSIPWTTDASLLAMLVLLCFPLCAYRFRHCILGRFLSCLCQGLFLHSKAVLFLR